MCQEPNESDYYTNRDNNVWYLGGESHANKTGRRQKHALCDHHHESTFSILCEGKVCKTLF